MLSACPEFCKNSLISSVELILSRSCDVAMKKKLHRASAVVLSLALLASAFTIAPNADAAPKTKKITLSAKKKTLTAGSKFKLKVKKVKPAKANKKVTWKTSKKTIATVSKTGVVTAKKAGTAKITATSKSNKKVKAVCTITVKAAKKPAPPAVTPTPTNAPTATPGPTGPAPSKEPEGPTPTPAPTPTITLPEDALKDYADFNVGTVVNYDKTKDVNFSYLAEQQFDIVSFENEMKGYSLLDTEASKAGDGTPVCRFEKADEMVEWAISHGLKIRGHVLIWEHSMANSFFHIDYDEDKGLVDKETLLKRMQSYSMQVITHFETKYPGTVIAWDVINEAIDQQASKEDPTTGLRLYTSGNFYKIIGGDYIKYAFQYAKEAVKATGADIKLFYNDFNCFQNPKTGYIVKLIKYLNEDPENPLLDCMGMEGYVLTYWPNASDVKNAMTQFAKCGVPVGINELTVRLNQKESANKKEVTEKDITAHAQKYKDIFTAYCDFAAENPGMLTNVSIWGLLDRPDLEAEFEKPENERHYDYNIYGTHSGLFKADFEAKEAFFNVIDVLKEYY